MVELLGMKLPSFFDIGRKIIQGATYLGEKVSPIVNNKYVRGAINLLPPSISAPVNTGIDLFNKAIQNKNVFQDAINTGEQLVNRVNTAYDMARRGDIQGLAQSAKDTIEKINMARTRPAMAQSVSSMVPMAGMPGPRGPPQMMMSF